MTTTERKAARVTYLWDAPTGVDAGWYCESYDSEGELIDDSQKIWWPLDVDLYETAEELVAALAEAFPGATIEGTDKMARRQIAGG